MSILPTILKDHILMKINLPHQYDPFLNKVSMRKNQIQYDPFLNNLTLGLSINNHCKKTCYFGVHQK